MLAKMFLHGRYCYVAVTEMTEIESGHLNSDNKSFMVKLANGMQEKVEMSPAGVANLATGCIHLG